MNKFGQYHKDPEGYEELISRLYEQCPPLELPSEYARAFKNDLVMLTIRFARYKFIARVLCKHDHVLEVGCGYGLGCMFLSQHVRSVIGIDAQPDAVAEARRLCQASNASFEAVDFFSFAPSMQFDAVVSSDVLEHMTPEVGDKFIQKAANHLHPDGTFILGTPSKYSWEHQSEVSKLSHVHCYDRDEMLEKLNKVFGRVFPFSMNDELVHTGHPKMAWFYFFLCVGPR